MRDNNKLVLKKVFFVPHFKTKIIGTKKLTRNGYDVIFTKDECRVRTTQQGGIITMPNDKHGLYHLQAQNLKHCEPSKSVPRTVEVVDINEAHTKLGPYGRKVSLCHLPNHWEE